MVPNRLAVMGRNVALVVAVGLAPPKPHESAHSLSKRAIHSGKYTWNPKGGPSKRTVTIKGPFAGSMLVFPECYPHLQKHPFTWRFILRGSKGHMNVRISHSGSKAQRKGIPEVMVCRILMFGGPLEAPMVTKE